MNITMKEIISKRKKLWYEHMDISLDEEYRNATVEYLFREDSKMLRDELFNNPELLIESFFVIVDKNQMTVPFFLNPVQQKFIDILNEDVRLFKEGKVNHLKYLILKGRQQGFTSFINAFAVALAICRRNFSGYTLADSTSNAEDIFSDKGKFYFDNLPQALKPDIKYNTRRELDFNNADGTGLNSKWRVATAGNKDAGRSKTLNFFHGSEVAFWDNILNVLIGLAEAFTKQAIVILETTANGFNEYKELWDKNNNYKNLFFEWWLTPEYHLGFESESIKEDFIRKINSGATKEPEDVQSESWVFSRLKWLRDVKLIDDYSKLYWYYNKWKDKGESIKQEYPCTPEEAFLASGRNYFATSELIKRIDEVKGVKYSKGYFRYRFGTSPHTGEKIILNNSIEFIEDNKTGFIKIFKEPSGTGRYILSADTAGDGSDFNAGHILTPDGTQLAVIKLIEDEDLFADQLYCLGTKYNNALMAIETNFSTYVNNTLQNREYPNIYTRQTSPDVISGNYTNKIGFNTNKATRPALLGMLREIVRDEVYKINDEDTLKEMLSFVINQSGKPEAMQGYHDDLIMSYGIGLYCGNQIPPEQIAAVNIPDGYWLESELEDMGYPNYMIQAYLQRR